MMMVTLTRLLVISMVASVRSLSALSFSMLASLLLFSGSSSLRSLGDNEKKAISEPEANPETSSSSPASTIAKMAPAEGAIN